MSLGGGAAARNGGPNYAALQFEARCRDAHDRQERELIRAETSARLEKQEQMLALDRQKNAEQLWAMCREQSPTACAKACDAGLPGGCAMLGLMYVRGEGVAADPVWGKSLLRKACNEGGLVPACDALAEVLAEERRAAR